MGDSLKKGRISKSEDKLIKGYLDNNLTTEQIAKKLNRNPESVGTYIKKNFDIGTTQIESAAYSLKDRPYYVELKQQFTDDELELFQYHWARIVAQFNKDVLPTEELQIVDVIRMELLMNRCLKSNKDNIESINRLNRRAETFIEPLAPEEMEEVANIERQIGALRASQESLNKDYRDLQDKKGKMLKDMKGTREQRIKRLEDSRESFPAWVASLLQEPERLKRYGIKMEKMRLAMEAEKARLSQFHKYEDGQVDQPFLNHESVFEEDNNG